MIRMLRSPLKREEAWLNALLKEHVVCYVPDSRRKWQLVPAAFELDRAAQGRYDSVRGSRPVGHNPRAMFVEQKAVLRKELEGPAGLVARRIVEQCGALRTKGRRPLVFANSVKELAAIRDLLAPEVRLWHAARGRPVDAAGKPADGPWPLVVTTSAAAQGLNLQAHCDAIVCRPQPGDLLEQMKGRVDRPGQAAKALELVVCYAANTVEELEYLNIKKCGSFFRQYLDPLSLPFVQAALDEAADGKADGKMARRFKKLVDAGTPVAAGPDGARRAARGGDDAPPDVDAAASGAKKKKARGPAAAAPKQGPKKRSAAAANAKITDALGHKRKKQAIPAKRKAKAADLSTTVPPVVLTPELVDEAVRHLKARDPKVGAIITAVGGPRSLVPTFSAGMAFTSLSKSIVYQQLSTKVAAKIYARLEDACREAAGGGAGDGPALTPENVLAVPAPRLLKGQVGLSGRKAEYLNTLARAFLDGTLQEDELIAMSDQQVMEKVTALKGFGEWSAHMFLMFSLGRPDVLPVGDLAVRKAMKRLYGTRAGAGATEVNALPSAQEMREIAEKWRPYRSVATWYMWHAVETADAQWV